MKPIIDLQKQNVNFKQALVFELTLKSGERTKVVTAYNCNEVNFEELNKGIIDGLSNCMNVASCQCTNYSSRNGELVPTIKFEECVFDK